MIIQASTTEMVTSNAIGAPHCEWLSRRRHRQGKRISRYKRAKPGRRIGAVSAAAVGVGKASAPDGSSRQLSPLVDRN